MNVLFAASECAPFVKTGGLGDVIGALPNSLTNQDLHISVVLPKYEDIHPKYIESLEFVTSINVSVGWRQQYCGILKLEQDEVTYYFLDNEYYFKRHGSYGYHDDGERFAFFSRAVLESVPHFKDKPDIIHCHDWQTGPISVMLKAHYSQNPFYKDIKTVFTIHNLRYQGIYPKVVLYDLLELDDSYFHINGLEFYGNVNYMKAGLAYSDWITTVSPSYAEEIQWSYYGEQLDGFIRTRQNHLVGIINGIDDISYNPDTDDDLFQHYSDIAGKQLNKQKLQKKLHLPVRNDTPVVSMITRLVDQKGIDLILRVFHEMMSYDVQFVLLGTGDYRYEQAFKDLGFQYPDKASINIYFDESLARQIYSGSDLFLMPSQFEPCGIGQLIAFRYGTIPIVRETGGLKDTVTPYNEFTDEGTGFTFSNFNAHDMLYTIERALGFFHQTEKWQSLVEQAMKLDFSWDASAEKYHSLYKKLLQ
ncbi:glycogen synthase GlgA [Terrilactibacillus laevilacticus]|uniref:Glycogen synthase n=1 Tax=Terrilactibacillus laevilacticus TaxID=1380157 RepID=A0ABW5PRX1_9BACI|nr:glycogen synthase GlgA [Terrilactibacillus laevilacticus]